MFKSIQILEMLCSKFFENHSLTQYDLSLICKARRYAKHVAKVL